ncbi:acireductone synthase [Hyphomicrobium sp.]|uniref:acireductone synthase n=1 Tax=Hyphomicrobium sp. TaxID=82 RepID=UPI0025BD4868|nr:acireductone synthase [Hyphomicrobium sp.]MCC7253150.1 acireductone synthase [Hyphomicrobium sp.]
MALAASKRRHAKPRPLSLEGEAVLLDIEGTLGSISFVRDVLFAYSRERLSAFVETHREDPVVGDILAQASSLAGGGDAVAALQRWQDRDEKVPPLKKLQGLIWEDGYSTGAFQSPIFPDALAALKRWNSAGLPLYIYSSGSTQAQLLFFAHSTAGDLRALFSGHFDTDVGAKTEAASYALIAAQIGVTPGRIIFFSDNAKELEAAQSAGLQVLHVVKEDTRPVPGLRRMENFDRVEIRRQSSA